MYKLLYFSYFLIISLPGFSQSFTKFTDPLVSNKNGSWRSTAIIDYNNDYTLDIIMCNGNSGSNGLLTNLGDTAWADSSSLPMITQTSAAAQSFWADIDNDCDLDVYWPDVFSPTKGFYINQGNGSFSKVLTGPIVNDNTKALAANWFDYNNDGNVDLFIPSWDANDTNILYQNNGNLSFTRIDTGGLAEAFGEIWFSAPADFDSDGDIDVFLANRSPNGKNYLMVNQGNGQFINDTSSVIAKEGSNTRTASWGDYDNDGYIDLFVGRFQLSNYLYKNNGDGTFTKVNAGNLSLTNSKISGSIWADFDNDGYLDIYLTKTGTSNNTNHLFRNNGNGTFSSVSAGSLVTETYGTEGCNAADLNNDGFLDIINANRFSSPITIYHNDGNNNNFLKLKIYGSAANRDGLGSRIEIVSNSGKQVRHLTGIEGRRTQGSFVTHFGLGQDTIVDTLKIYWPGGGNCMITDVPANGFYNVGQLTCSLDSVATAHFKDSSRFFSAHFSNLSHGSISNYLWDFGDGQTSTSTNPTHQYAQSGSYEVKLTVFDQFCNKTFIKDSITICPDTAHLGFSATGSGRLISFSDTSISNGHHFQWNFGDGNSGTGNSVNYRYSQAGTYTACLYVTDSCRVDTVCRTLTVCNDTLQAAFSSTIAGLTLNISDSSINAEGYLWDFGDGKTDTSSSPVHTYMAPGTYTVCLIINDNCYTDTLCKTIAICPNPAVSGFNFIDTSNTVHFQSNVQNATSYLWDFGDGSFSTNPNPTYTYQANGTYTVCLIVSNNCNSDTTCKTVNICPKVGSSGYTHQRVSGLTVQFYEKGVNAVSYMWDFDDGNYSHQKNPLYAFNSAWFFDVCLTITDSCGKEDTYCEEVDLHRFNLKELNLLKDVKVYPNPVVENLTVNVPGARDRDVALKMHNLQGKVVLQKSDVQETVVFPLAELPAGVYLLTVSIDGVSRQFKVTRQ